MRLQTYADQGYLCAERVESLSENQKKVLGLNIIYHRTYALTAVLKHES